jgi:hypothetical protein
MDMFYYKVIHKYRSADGDETKEIGIFSSKERAFQAINAVKDKPGFVDHQDGFSAERILRLFKPSLTDQIFWRDGFDTYYFSRQTNEICCDEEKKLMQHFSFLLTEYGFRFDKPELGDMVDENGKRWFYGPYNCYYFYNDQVCVNFMNLVQRQDWNVYITNEVLSDQNLIKKGKAVPGNLCYNWSLLASAIREELAESQTILGIRIN